MGLLQMAAPAVLAERPRIYAITGATIVPSPGRRIETGTVVLRDGLIEAVGADVRVPPDAVVIGAKGQWVYPGLIDPDSRLGLEEEEAAPPAARAGSGEGRPERQARRQQAPPGAVHPISRIRPERQVRDQLLPFEDDRKAEMEKHRNLGFTTVLVTPRSGIFRGQSAALLLLEDTPVSELLLRDGVAQHLGFEHGRFSEAYPTSLMGSVAAIRQALLDAEAWGTWSERYGLRPAGMPHPERLAAYEALVPVLARRMPVVFELGEPADFLLADRLAREFGLDAAVSGSGHEWEIAEEVARSGRFIILPVAQPDKPKVEEEGEALDVTTREMRRYLGADEGPRRLHEAGAKFAFTTRGLKNLADLPKRLRKILDAGLREEMALAAWTTSPAMLLGIDRVAGTLEPGKIANVIVADGPLFEEKTKIRRVFVDGNEFEIEEKKKPKGDPNAVVDPRGEWSVVFELEGQTVQRTWTVAGKPGDYSGTAETRSGTVRFDTIELVGNMLTVTYAAGAGGGGGPAEITVIITGDTFEGTGEMGTRSVPVRGTRTSGPEGGGGR